ncbi:lysoplasmalogenase [Saccharospirillum impatiens]|uniref:lysoplasmalogenase n=1 Tax=Saccharospirillum impatiens TaxID=169438 RepID=UPI0003F9CACF|nr:lysoplasmalogenase [Saccharospirillum impatiens]
MSLAIKQSYWALVLIYLIAMLGSPFAFEWVIKAAPIWLLAFSVLRQPLLPAKPWVLLAILVSSLGDVLLEVNLFVFGLGAFLIAQLTYGVLFARRYAWRPVRFAWVLFLLVWALAVLIWCWPNLGALTVPVLAYMVAILWMGVAALNSRYSLYPAFFGAGVFILSDSLIAIGLFASPFPGQPWAVMLTYYLAQYCIVQALMRD